MVDENQATPDVASGYASQGGSTSPDTTSGYGGEVQQQGVDRAQHVPGSPEAGSQQPDYEALRNSFNQKITEMGQTNAELQRRLQSFEQTQQQRNEALARALGYGQQEQQRPDVLSQLVDDPEWLEQRIKEVAQQQVAPIQEQLQTKEIQAYAAEQQYEKQEVLTELSKRMEPELAKQVMESINVSHLVPHEVLQMNQRLQNDPMLSPEQRAQMEQKIQNETWKAMQKAGGYRKLAYAAAGEMLFQNFDGLMQSAAKTMRSQQFASNRAQPYGGMTGGAAVQSSSGGSGFRSESFFK